MKQLISYLNSSHTSIKLVLLLIYVAIPLLHINDYAWIYDEGVLLQTAALSHKGYPLYAETVVNKPPLFVWWVQLSFAIGSIGIVPARLSVLLLTAVFFWLLGSLAKMWWGKGADIAVMAAYLLLPEAIVRAAVVINDLPAMLLMIAALYAATRFYVGRQKVAATPAWGWAVAAGLFYGMGVGVHPLLLYMALPLGLLLAWPFVQQQQWLAVLRVGLVAGGTAVLVTLAWLLLVDWPGFWQWVVVYNRLPLDPTLQAKADRNLLNLAKAHWQHGFLVLPALWAAWLVWRRGNEASRFFLSITAVWYLITLAILLTLQPMWLHYVIFVFIPLVLVFGGGIAHSLQKAAAEWTLADRGLWGLTAVLLLFGLLLPREWVIWQPAQAQAVAHLQANLPPDAFVISDDPHVLFAAEKYVPPSLADGSTKRISTQLLTTADVIQAGWQYDVTTYVLTNGRFQQLPSLLNWVEAIGQPVASFEPLTIVQLPSQPRRELAIGAVFNDMITLENAVLALVENESGSMLTGTFFWQTAVSPPADYKIFVHLLDNSGNLVAQYDGDPQQGWLPTSQWVPVQPIVDSWQMMLPAETAVGTYTIAAGLYTWPEIQRLPARLASGETAVNNIVPISKITLSGDE